MTQGIIRWEDPPPPGKRSQRYPASTGKWRAILDDLLSEPGRWALVDICRSDHVAGSVAHSIRTGKMIPLTRGDFEATSRRDHVYARYLGDGVT